MGVHLVPAPPEPLLSGAANLAALPAAASNRNVIAKTTDGGVYISDGSAWQQISPPTGTYALPFGPIATRKPSLAVGGAVASAVGNQNNGYLTVLSDGFYNGPGAPGFRKLPDGRYLIVFRRGTAHSVVKGSLYGMIGTVTNGDLAFGAEFLIYTDATYDSRDAQITVLADGRVAMSFFLEDPATGLVLGGNGCRVMFLPAGADPSVSANWGAPVTVADGWNSRSACSGPVVQAPGGTLYLAVYGRNGDETYDSVKVIQSTDNGVTWGSAVKVADGQAATKNYGEATMTWVATRGQFLIQTRCTEEQSVYRLYSANGGGAAYTSPVLAHVGNSSPRTIQLASGRVLCLVRGADGTQNGNGVSVVYNSSGRTLVVASDDEGITWGDPAVLDTTVAGCLYGDFQEMPTTTGTTGVVACIYGLEIDASHAVLRLRYLADRAAVTPHGKVLARGVSVVEGDLEAYGQARVAHFGAADGRRPTWDVEQYTDTDGITKRSRLRMYDPYTAATLLDLTKDGFQTVSGAAAAPYDKWNEMIVPTVQSPASNVNWTTIGVAASLLMGGYLASSGAQNDEMVYNAVLPPGTWTIELMVQTAASFGIIEVFLDGVSKGTLDTYSVGTTSNVRLAIGGVAVANINGSAKHQLKFKMTAKNASSSSYTGRVISINCKRTA